MRRMWYGKKTVIHLGIIGKFPLFLSNIAGIDRYKKEKSDEDLEVLKKRLWLNNMLTSVLVTFYSLMDITGKNTNPQIIRIMFQNIRINFVNERFERFEKYFKFM